MINNRKEALIIFVLIGLIAIMSYKPTPRTPLNERSNVVLHCKEVQLTFLNVHEFVVSYETQYRDIEQVCQEAIEHDHIYGDRIQIIYREKKHEQCNKNEHN